MLLADNFEYLFLMGDRTIRKLSTDNNSELFKIEVDSKIQCGLVFNNYILVGSNYLLIKPKRERSKYGLIRTIRNVSISRRIRLG